MYTNAGFQSIGTTSDFPIKFTQNYVNDKTLEKINIKIVINIIATNVPCTKFQLIWRTSDFAPGPNLTKKI